MDDEGITQYSISKDKDSISVPLGMNVIARNKMTPGQKIKGTIMMQTNQGEADSKHLSLVYGGKKIHFD